MTKGNFLFRLFFFSLFSLPFLFLSRLLFVNKSVIYLNSCFFFLSFFSIFLSSLLVD